METIHQDVNGHPSRLSLCGRPTPHKRSRQRKRDEIKGKQGRCHLLLANRRLKQALPGKVQFIFGVQKPLVKTLEATPHLIQLHLREEQFRLRLMEFGRQPSQLRLPLLENSAEVSHIPSVSVLRQKAQNVAFRHYQFEILEISSCLCACFVFSVLLIMGKKN